MGYHIFTLRKEILTHQVNDVECNMMIKWTEQMGLQDQVSALYSNYAQLTEPTEQQRNQFSAQLTALSNREDALEREIQLLETKYSERSQELTKCEEQEKTAMEQDIPVYSGAGGNK